MPVRVAITVADPPAAPAHYSLCAFEARSRATDGEMQPLAVFAGTTAGFEDAANVLISAVQASLRTAGVGLRLAAVAWWSEKPLGECVAGRERLVSVYDAGSEVWGEWTPETRVGSREMGGSQRSKIAVPQRAGLDKISTSTGNR